VCENKKKMRTLATRETTQEYEMTWAVGSANH
jgi:hypothetical protein